MDTLLLDTAAWDLLLDADGNIAVASDPYSLAQDAASAIRTFLGECFFDTTLGINYALILGQAPVLALIKQLLTQAALTVPEVNGAQIFIASLANRTMTGQVQVTSSGQVSAASFTVINPQGV